MASRPSPFTETGELTPTGRWLAIRTLVLAALVSILGFSLGNTVVAIVLPLLAIALPVGVMVLLRHRARKP